MHAQEKKRLQFTSKYIYSRNLMKAEIREQSQPYQKEELLGKHSLLI